MSSLIDPGPGRVKMLRMRPPGHIKHCKISTGATSINEAKRFMHRVDSLLTARANSDAPPIELQPWINTLDRKSANRLVKIGLLDYKRVQRGVRLTDDKTPRSQRRLTAAIEAELTIPHVDLWYSCVAARKNNTKDHADRFCRYLRHFCKWLKWSQYEHINATDAQRVLKEKGMAPSTRAQYLIGLRDFCEWMVRERRASKNPIKDVTMPRPVPQWDRRPFEPSEFSKLLSHMETFDRYDKQAPSSLWNAADRRLIYWTAVKTGLRKSELASLKKCHLKLDTSPATIDMPATNTKNSKRCSIPIPPDLADELREYTQLKTMGAPVFWMSSGKKDGGLVPMLHRDMKGAGLGHLLETEQRIDFHCLRSTAITWWLECDRLDVETVRRLARLSSLAVVQRYVRGARMESYDWLNRSTMDRSRSDRSRSNTA